MICSGRQVGGYAAVRAAHPSGGAVCCVGAAASLWQRLEVAIHLLGILVCQSVHTVCLG